MEKNRGMYLKVPFLFVLIAWGTGACDNSTAPSAPAANPYSVTGVLTYSGSLGPVSGSKRLLVELKTTPDLNPAGTDLFMQATTNGAGYSVNPSNVGTFYLAAYLGAVSLPCEPGSIGQTPTPYQGDPYYFYTGTPCGTAAPLTITSGQPSASITIHFDDTCLLGGVSGNLSYTGTHTITSSNGIVVLLYKDSGYTNRDTLSYNYLTCNSTNYNLATNSSVDEYLMAFVDLAGTGLPASGDPYLKFGAITPSPTLTQDLSFGDTLLP